MFRLHRSPCSLSPMLSIFVSKAVVVLRVDPCIFFSGLIRLNKERLVVKQCH